MEGNTGETAKKLPSTVEGVFKDFQERRMGLIKAFTIDLNKLRQRLRESENGKLLCLHGLPGQSWDLRPAFEDELPNIPESLVGINVLKGPSPNSKEWRDTLTVHYDAWLFSVAMFCSGSSGFNTVDRGRLFRMITDVRTVAEVVREYHLQENTPARKNKNKISGSMDGESDKALEVKTRSANTNKGKVSAVRSRPLPDDEETEAVCCGASYSNNKDALWLCCVNCKRWCHEHCLSITPAPESLAEFICPTCGSKSKQARI